MIHFIYIYLMINSFVFGNLAEDYGRDYNFWPRMGMIILTLAFALPYILITLLINFISLYINFSIFGNLIFIFRYKIGRPKPLTVFQFNTINENAKRYRALAEKQKLSLTTRSFLWGAKAMNEYLRKQKPEFINQITKEQWYDSLHPKDKALIRVVEQKYRNGACSSSIAGFEEYLELMKTKPKKNLKTP